MNRRKIIIIGIILILLVTISPLLMDWIILGNKVPSNLSNAEWANFFGSYIGAIIGSVFSLLGIVITIIFTNAQNKKDRELQIRPYLDISYCETESLIKTSKSLGHILYSCDSSEPKEPFICGLLILKNIGIGTMTNFTMRYEADDKRQHFPVLLQSHTGDVRTNYLQSGEEISIPIYIALNFDPISKEDCFIENGQKKVSLNVLKKYQTFKLYVDISYTDILQDKYCQHIVFQSRIGAEIGPNDDVGKYRCGLYIDSISTPQKTKKDID